MAEENKTEEQASESNESQNTNVAQTDNFFDADMDVFTEENGYDTDDSLSNGRNMELLFDLELPVSVELARKEMLIRDVLQLGEGSIIKFDKLAGENVELLINNKKVAEGEVIVIDERFGVRITNLLSPIDRLKGIAK